MIMIPISIVMRILAALVGGYALAALFSVATLALPMRPAEAALLGMTGSFLLYTGAVIWVFASRSACYAWLGLCAVALALLPPAVWVWMGEAA